MPVNRGSIGKSVQDVNVVAGNITLTGSIAAAIQYAVGTTGVSTGTGMVMLGIQSDTARGLKVASDGTVFITGTVSGGAGGIQYVSGTTSPGSTGTGTIFLGINSTTAVAARVGSDGTVFVTHTGTANVSVVNAIIPTTGTVTALPSGTQDVNIINSSRQYVQDTTTIGATGTGTLFIGVNATTARAIKVTADGTIFVTNAGTQTISGTVTAIPSNTGTLSNVLTVGTVLGILAISGTVDGTFGAGKQYVQDSTTIGATGTGTLFIGINATTARAAKFASDGTIFVTGTVTASGGAAGVQYVQDTTAQANTATGTVFLGINATTVKGFRLSTTGDPGVSQVGTWNISTVSTLLGTMTVTAANVTIASVTTGTMNVVNVLSASGVTVASITTGTVTSIPSGTQTVLVAAQPIGISGSVTPLGQPFAIYQTHISTQWNSGLVTVTTSAAGVGGILKTSAANTVYVTDLIVSVDVPMNIQLRSATTAMAILYLATKGGMAYQFKSPMVCTTAQSLTFLPSASGSASVWAAGYTVT